MGRKEKQELRKLHKLIVHFYQTVGVKDWHRLARTETRQIVRLNAKDVKSICGECFA